MQDFGIYTGLELSEEEYRKLHTAASEMSAKMRAVRIVSASSVSKRSLEERLVRKGEDPQQAKEAVQWMEDLHLVDDRNTAEQVVHSCISKGYGLARAKQALYEKRIPKEFWEEALAEYPDQMEYILRFLRKSLDAEPDEEGYINIDLDEVVDYVVKQAKKEGEMGPYAPEDVFFVVQGEMEYGDSLEE